MSFLSERSLSSSILRVTEIDPESDPRWEAFVASHPQGSVYHHPGWLKALELEYGRSPLNLACEDGAGNLLGVLPLLSTRGVPFRMGGPLEGRRLSSLPRTPVAGPLATDRQALTALLNAAIENLHGERNLYLQLKLASSALDGLIDGLAGVPWRLTYILKLPNRPEELHFGNSRNHARIKWNVRTAGKHGVFVRPAENESDLCAWYKLYLETMRWHAVPPRSYRFFLLLWRLLGPRRLMRLLLAEQHCPTGWELLAGSIFLSFGRTVFYAFNGVRRQDFRLYPNDVLQWHAISEACNEGFSFFDFGEVACNQDGLAKFKSKWGAIPTLLYRYYYPAACLREAADKSPSALHRLLAAGWRCLPLKATGALGGWIYSYL